MAEEPAVNAIPVGVDGEERFPLAPNEAKFLQLLNTMLSSPIEEGVDFLSANIEDHVKNFNMRTLGLQVLLNRVDPSLKLSPSGKFDPETAEAVYAFQDKYGITEDGAAGKEVVGVFNRILYDPSLARPGG